MKRHETKLTDPIAAYNAESNMDVFMAQRFLESEGLQAFVIEDNSLVGHWMFGNLPVIARVTQATHSHVATLTRGTDLRRIYIDVDK